MYLQRKSVGPLADGSSSTNTLAWWDNGSSALGWWETEGLASGSYGTESLSEHLISAPNLHPANALPKAVYWVNNYKSEFLPDRISVGPPGARLSALQLPAGNYHVKFVSRFKRKADWGGELSLGYLAEDNRPVEASRERGTILVLHDYGSQKESMSPWAYVLAQAGYRVVLIDLRGHGQSTGRTISYGKFETADLKRVLDYAAGRSSGPIGRARRHCASSRNRSC
jgi:predicted alpha/beta-fold hydrolase